MRPAPARILFLSHTGSFSGAENTMLRLLERLPQGHARAVACPSEGSLAPVLHERAIQQFDLPGTDISFKLSPAATAGGLARMGSSAWQLRTIARRFRADVIHANSTRGGLIAVAARKLGGPPVVVQCHDNMPRSSTGSLVCRIIANGAGAVVAPSQYTAQTFNRALKRPVATTVHVSIDSSRFNPAVPSTTSIRSELSIPESAPILAHVAQITPWKGQDTAIKALALIRRELAAHLLVVGGISFQSRRYDNEGFGRRIRRLADELDVSSSVHFLNHRGDVPQIMRAADLLVLPSWDEPFGTSVLEGMAVGTPALVTSEGGVREFVEDGVNGRVLPPRAPGAWAAAALEVLTDRSKLAAMRENTIPTAARFTDEHYASGMLEAYERALGTAA